MRTLAGMLLLVLSLSASAQSGKQKDASFPAMIVNARFVMVTTIYGTEYDRNVSTEDRQAVADVQNQIQKWGRYTLAYKPQDADIIIVVRSGRLVSASGGVAVTVGTDRPTATGPLAGYEVGPADDMLAVFDARSGIDAAPLWRRLQRNGLADKMPLFQDFRKTVETAAKP